MIALLFLACLAHQPDRCQRFEVSWEGSMQECMLFAQQRVAAWMNEHPRFAPPRRFACTIGTRS
ncbi:MAG: hypothetical protein U1E45_06335 [Geminicoccaceae bacterium]